MASLSNQRNVKPGSIHEDLPIYNAPTSANHPAKKKCQSFVPAVVFLVVIAEIALLGRLDMAKNAALLADSFYQFTSLSSKGQGFGALSHEKSFDGGDDGCEEWLEKVDNLNYSRDFQKEPILICNDEQEPKSCPVGCKFELHHEKPDACLWLSEQPETSQVLRSMESSHYYSENSVDSARRRGYDIVMTTSLSSDVPVGYFSWAEYDIMAPPQPKTEKAMAAAFISNCNARNFRLQALEALEEADVKIDSYGSCHRNRDGNKVDKVETLKRYKFSLAFENSNEEDYVTEKFFQSLVAGSVPIVVGAPNIQDFAPSPGSFLHIKDLKDAESVAKSMKYLAENANAYNQSLRWKFDGPSDAFKALFDMAAVHSSCRLCIYVATKIREKEEQNSRFLKRPCKCTRGLQTVYHLYVRERGRFEMQSIFLRSSNLTLEALESAVLLKFKSLKHIPIWKQERPKSIRGGDDELKIYRVYPLGKTQREALYTFRFQGDAQLRSHIERNPCAKFEVIFV